MVVYSMTDGHDCMRYVPGVQHHVEEEPPKLEPLVGSVDEDTVDGHGTGGVDLPIRNRVVCEETQLKHIDFCFIYVALLMVSIQNYS